MNLWLLILIIVLLCVILFLLVLMRFQINGVRHILSKVQEMWLHLERIEKNLKDEFRYNREENSLAAKELRTELSSYMKSINEQNMTSFKDLNKTLDDKLQLLTKSLYEGLKESRDQLDQALKDHQENFDKNVQSFNLIQKEKFEQLDSTQQKLIDSTEKKLDLMRETVDEKLQKTLHLRISQSFENVGKQLQAVQEGLGEMKNIAQDVGGLKKVLGNVKMRGGIGEVQLSMLLEQILAPDQYAANVKTKKGSSDHVEFALKLPGKEDGLEHVWLPIDAKFPKDYFEQLQKAHEEGDLQKIEFAQKSLENAIRKMAKDIADKYIDVPFTTDFGIMFLPFEGIYAEVVRKASLLEDLQRNYKIIVTGPTTLAAILNSLHMGFRTLAIQKRSSEVWKVLGAVKTEFEKFGNLMTKAQKNIQTGLDDLDSLVGTRTNVIKRKLRSIEALSDEETRMVLPEMMTDDRNNKTNS